MVSTKAQLLWFETTTKKLGKNRGILKPSLAFVKTKSKKVSVFNFDLKGVNKCVTHNTSVVRGSVF